MRYAFPRWNRWCLYCFDSDGNLIWRTYGPPTAYFNAAGSVEGPVIKGSGHTAMGVWDDKIFMGWQRSTYRAIAGAPILFSSNAYNEETTGITSAIPECFTVSCYGVNGSEIWRSDVGANVLDMTVVPGIGLLVQHEYSHHVSDSFTISAPLQPSASIFVTGVRITEDMPGNACECMRTWFNGQFATATPTTIRNYWRGADVPFSINPTRLPGSCMVSGVNFVSGITFLLNDSLAGPTGLRPLPRAATLEFNASPTTRVPILYSCASMANLTMLDMNTGAILWRQYTPSTNAIWSGVADWAGRGVFCDQSGTIYVHRPQVNDPSGLGVIIPQGVTVLNSSGGIVSQINYAVNPPASPSGRHFAVHNGVICHNTNRYNLSGALLGQGIKGPYYLDYSTGNLWGSTGSLNAVSNSGILDPTIPAIVGSVYRTNPRSSAVPLGNGLVGGADVSTNRVAAYYPSGVRKWSRDFLELVGGTSTVGCLPIGYDQFVLSMIRSSPYPNLGNPSTGSANAERLEVFENWGGLNNDA